MEMLFKAFLIISELYNMFALRIVEMKFLM